MSEAGETKVCPLCAETIQAVAKVCPHCRYWQRRWSLANPFASVTIYSVMWIIVIVGAMTFCEKAFGPKEEFAVYRNEIAVVSSEFSQRTASSNLYVTVVGTLTNQSDIGWKDVSVEARFFDRSGKMIDAITVNADGYHGVVILPHGEAAFKIEGRAAHVSGDYGTNQIAVRWAKDVHAWLP
jgi:hypothetical protein